MKFESITIKNFRNFEDVKLDLSNKNIFFGLNDVGKTNFLYALRYVFDKEVRKQNLLDSDFHNKQIEKPIEIVVTIDISDVADSDCQKLRAQLKGALLSEHNKVYIKLFAEYSKTEMLALPILSWGGDINHLYEMKQRGYLYEIDYVFNVIYIDSYVDLYSLFKKNVSQLVRNEKDEDKDILVCHKPAGLAVQNARVGSMDMESLLKNYIAQKVPGKMPYLGIIHRLDQPVEGVLVFALNPKAAADLSRQMTAGKIKKTYLAVTEGTVKVKSAKLVDWLKKDGRTNSSAVVEGGTSGAKKAILSYEVLETWKNKEDAQDCGERNLIRIDLDTGRHHQIRVQMAHAGMPLVGDRKYNPGQNSQEPLALCSAKLGFQHPVTKKQLEFQVQPAGMAFKRH